MYTNRGRVATVMPPEYSSARKRDNLAICWLMFLGWVLAAPPVFAARPQGVTLKGVQAKLSEIQAKKGLPDDLKTRLVNLYQLAQHQLETAQELQTERPPINRRSRLPPARPAACAPSWRRPPPNGPQRPTLTLHRSPSWNGSWSLRRPVSAP